MRAKTIEVPLYFERLKIVVTDTLPDPEHHSYVLFQKHAIALYIKPNVSAGVIAHESVHIVNYVFKRCHIALDIDNDEAQAYLTGWVVEQITKAVSAYSSKSQPIVYRDANSH